MKVFISMPMKSKSTEQCKVEMGEVFKVIKKKLPEAKLIDSVIDGADTEIALKGDDIGCWYLGKSIGMLSEADLVFFGKGWEEARGCRIEREISEAYGKFCVELK